MHDTVLVELRTEALALPVLDAHLLDADRLAKLAHSMGLGWFTEADVLGLWRIGILRSDEVSSPTPVERPSLRRFDGPPTAEESLYGDARPIEYCPNGYASSIGETSITAEYLRPRFHPSRLYVLYHVQRTMKFETSSTQFLQYEDGVQRVVARELEQVRRWTSSVTFAERFEYWNSICEIAFVCDLCTSAVLHAYARPALAAEQRLAKYEARVRTYLANLGRSRIHQMREDLAFAAETLDDNRYVHVLLRLMSPRERGRLKSRLGCAMHFLAMAETIRRVAEAALATPLPEEDEIGPGQWFPGARKMLYGSDRVFDASPRELRDYLTLLGLDFGVKVRCYVEGATEYGALVHAVGDLGHVQIIDLSGSFAERRGKGLAFAESLESDKKAGIFSVILLDGDRSDNVRLVERAAKEERFAGSYFVAEPDFEYANFSTRELLGLAVSLSRISSLTAEPAADLTARILLAGTSVGSNGELFSLLADHGVSDVGKDERWGKTLMAHAIAHPTFGDGDARAGKKRPVLEAIEVILRIRSVGFLRSVARERVDPMTGRSVPRDGVATPSPGQEG